jgi:hypothetical protein
MVFSLFFSSILATLKFCVPDIYITMVLSMHNVYVKDVYDMLSMSTRNQGTQGTTCHKQMSHHDVCNVPVLLHPAQQCINAISYGSSPTAACTPYNSFRRHNNDRYRG